MSDGARTYGRLPRYHIDELTDAQQGLIDSLAAKLDGKLPRSIVDDDGGISGAFNFMLVDPVAGGAFISLGDALARPFAPRQREILILETARVLDCPYEREQHEPLGRKAGLTEPEIESLRSGAGLDTFDEREQLTREVVAAVLGPRDLPDDLHARALDVLGLVGLWNVVALAGYYALMNTLLVGFRAPLLGRHP